MPNGQKADWQTLRQKKKNNQQLLELQCMLQEELQRREQLASEIASEKSRNQVLEQELMECKFTIQELKKQR